MKAYLKNYRQSPRKVRLLADFIRGKDVDRALSEVFYLSKRAALPIKKLIESATANAKENFDMEQKDLMIKDITVDQGFTLKRFTPRAFGRASKINKRTSNIRIVLAPKETKDSAEKEIKASKSEIKKPKSKKEENTNTIKAKS